MAAKNVHAFFEKVEGDKGLQTKLKAVHQKITKDGKAQVTAAVVKIAIAAGFKITAGDLAKARAAKVKKLPSSALADVTGQEWCSMNYCCDSSWYCRGPYWST